MRVELTGVIQQDKVTVSPGRLGAGPVLITISNQTEDPHTVILEGESLLRRTGVVDPRDTATIQSTLAPGSYEVSAGPRRRWPRRSRLRCSRSAKNGPTRTATCSCPDGRAGEPYSAN